MVAMVKPSGRPNTPVRPSHLSCGTNLLECTVNIIKTILVSLLALFAAAAFAAVDVNKATQAELEGIKGIGPSMSAKILDARKTGAFKDWADMQSRVKGVRNGNSAKFSADGLTVNGAAFTAVATDVKPAKGAKSAAKAAK
jgi:competence protein ComEA